MEITPPQKKQPRRDRSYLRLESPPGLGGKGSGAREKEKNPRPPKQHNLHIIHEKEELPLLLN
ncbi:hypothetical protein DC28_11375 [Spirochaeta lutea]|uniref:Uncharacterized protein n=1 Tax=Spirochaeta lutea TaxID=1480694 RepID=A0A098QU88_9SPIO|nr:hypothetical protein DC28_11375 [Spirochaeta lutea]